MVRMLVNFTYSYLSSQLELSVWIPHLPLQIDLSDPELSQIKGWRVPVFGVKRPSWESEEDDEKKGRGCMLQYQHSLVRVLTAFTAEASDSNSGSVSEKFLGPDWLVDVTGLVRYSLRVGDTSVARLQAGTVLSGRAAGVTTIQVMSPLSDAVLGERMVRVLDDKVSITELGVQLVSGLVLNLQLSPGSNRAIAATTTTQDTMRNPKQEAAVACWVKLSDGSQTPLDLFDPSGYTLALSSLDKKVVSVRTAPGRVVVVAEAEGQGLLLRAELAICEACQKSKRKSKLAVGAGTARVRFPSAEQPAGESGRMRAGVRGANDYAGVSTIRAVNGWGMNIGIGIGIGIDKALKRFGNLLDNLDNFPSQELELPKESDPSSVESDLMRTFGIFTDLEICIYSLIGVSCLAIIAILLNCATHNAKSQRSKKSPVQQCQGPGGQDEHKHHWVRFGTAAEQSRAVPIVTEMPRRTATLGRRTNTLPPRPDPMAVRSATLLPRPPRSDPLHSPTSKRNQVQFTTFTTLDIKHLAALKRNGMDFNWTSRDAGGANQATEINLYERNKLQ
uniref:Si:dkey-1d7.3 n=1 Tax=Astyanax mexicanus TaxID=7994 RepID=A0A8B9GZQ0_ASTMX